MNGKLLTTGEAAKRIGLRKSRLEHGRASDDPAKRLDIPFIKVGRNVYYNSDDLDAWVASHKRTSLLDVAGEFLHPIPPDATKAPDPGDVPEPEPQDVPGPEDPEAEPEYLTEQSEIIETIAKAIAALSDRIEALEHYSKLLATLDFASKYGKDNRYFNLVELGK